MQSKKITFLAIVAFTDFLLATKAAANLRPPRYEDRSPSMALGRPSQNATVAGTQIQVICIKEICEVDVVYDIEMSTDERLSLSFVTPTANDVMVEVGKQKRFLKAVRRDNPLATAGVFHQRVSVEVFDAEFVADFYKGPNKLHVSYKQPLSRIERGRGYFQNGKFVDVFRYELWPLADWVKKPAFRLTVDVQVLAPRRGTWQGFWEDPFQVYCFGSSDEGIQDPLPKFSTNDQKSLAYRRFDFGTSFPHAFVCEYPDG